MRSGGYVHMLDPSTGSGQEDSHADAISREKD